MPYLRAFVRETFRVWPNGTEVSRYTEKDMVSLAAWTSSILELTYTVAVDHMVGRPVFLTLRRLQHQFSTFSLVHPHGLSGAQPHTYP